MSKHESRNAHIESTMLGWWDGGVGGIMTAFINFDFGDSSHQGFGGYGLDTPVKKDGKTVRVGGAWGMEYIRRVLEVLEVEKWENLKGTPARVVGGGFGGNKIQGIGHFSKDKWFFPDTDLAYLLKEASDE